MAHPLIGQRYRCTHPGSTLLVLGHTYTVMDVADGGFNDLLIELDHCPGMLFGLWRFEPLGATDDHPTE